ncbi:MAG: hypothetical protein R2684_07245 [Pyrinomonadaceae bacterium]
MRKRFFPLLFVFCIAVGINAQSTTCNPVSVEFDVGLIQKGDGDGFNASIKPSEINTSDLQSGASAKKNRDRKSKTSEKRKEIEKFEFCSSNLTINIDQGQLRLILHFSKISPVERFIVTGIPNRSGEFILNPDACNAESKEVQSTRICTLAADDWTVIPAKQEMEDSNILDAEPENRPPG